MSYSVKHEYWYSITGIGQYNDSGFGTDTIILNYAKEDYGITEFYNNQLIAN